MDIADFLIHTQPELSPNERTHLESEIGGMDGVVSAHFSPRHPHMMEIAYNPDVVSSGAVLERVGRHGIAVTKVGL